jgi:hypothetical protein
MIRAIAIVVLGSFIAGYIVAYDAHGATINRANCVVYDTNTNTAVWVERSRVKVARFVDLGDDAYWVANQVTTRVPIRVHNVVTNWPVRPHRGFRVRCANARFVRDVKGAIRTCANRVEKGDAYTREMFDVCVGMEVRNV